MRISVVNGPNLNMLGQREPEVYGRITLAEIERQLRQRAQELGHEIAFFQSNHEGALVDYLNQLFNQCDVLLLNAAAFSHTSVALRDALAMLKSVKVEVHLSHIHSREEFRHRSLTAPVCDAFVAGFGAASYMLALEGGLQLALGRQSGNDPR